MGMSAKWRLKASACCAIRWCRRKRLVKVTHLDEAKRILTNSVPIAIGWVAYWPVLAFSLLGAAALLFGLMFYLPRARSRRRREIGSCNTDGSTAREPARRHFARADELPVARLALRLSAG